MKRETVKFIALLMVFVCIFSLFGCSSKNEQNNQEESLQDVANKNTKAIVGVWIVESVEKKETETMNDFGTSAATNLFFTQNSEIQFLSNGTFTSGIYNLKYEMVDNQFIFTYKEQAFAYDCEIKGDTMLLSTPNFVTITLKKQ